VSRRAAKPSRAGSSRSELKTGPGLPSGVMNCREMIKSFDCNFLLLSLTLLVCDRFFSFLRLAKPKHWHHPAHTCSATHSYQLTLSLSLSLLGASLSRFDRFDRTELIPNCQCTTEIDCHRKLQTPVSREWQEVALVVGKATCHPRGMGASLGKFRAGREGI